jgi:CRISPR system Cascade subunit CasE
MKEVAFFSRLTLKRDASAVAPLIEVLAPKHAGDAMATGHRLMWTVMPEHVRLARATQESPFLWRAAGDGRKYYMLGPAPVSESPFFEVETKPFEPRLSSGDRLAFNLRVNATVDRKTGEVDGRAVRARIDVALDRMHAQEANIGDIQATSRAERRQPAAEAAAKDWLTARAERDGFRLVTMKLDAYRAEVLPRRGKPARIGVFDLQGLLEVTAPEAFMSRLLCGFGRAKAFGCGLMLLRRAPAQ